MKRHSILPLLLVVGWNVANFIQVRASSISHADDVTVMLSVKSFTRTDSENEEQHQAAVEVRNEVLSMVSQDLKEADQQSSPNDTLARIPGSSKSTPLNSTPVNSTSTEGFSDFLLQVHKRPATWFGIGGAVLLVCCCTYSLGVLKLTGRRGNTARPAADCEPVEVWQKESQKSHHDRLIALFERLDEVHQDADSPPGFINASDLLEALQDRELARELNILGISKEEANSIFRLLDRDDDGFVSLQEYVAGICLDARETGVSTGVLNSHRAFEKSYT